MLNRLVNGELPNNKILTAADCMGARVAGGWHEYLIVEHEAAFGRLPNVDVHQTVGVVDAWVKCGKWTVTCPFCGDHIYADERLPFLCLVCGNEGNRLRPMGVRFPVMRGVIERILLRRGVVKTRNWVVGESLRDLVLDNMKLGIY